MLSKQKVHQCSGQDYSVVSSSIMYNVKWTDIYIRTIRDIEHFYSLLERLREIFSLSSAHEDYVLHKTHSRATGEEKMYLY